jgi:hypothetical protein
MKVSKLLAFYVVAASFGICSCNNAAQENKGSGAAASSDASKTSASSGDASFSCKIDGKDFSGKGTDQIVNAASVHAPGIIYFSLSPSFTGDPGADIRGGGIGFEVPDKGTTVIRGVENSDYSIGYNPPNEPTNTYNCKEMTVTINSSGTTVTGTFSGTLIEPKTGREVPVSDGKFDIPYSTLGKK